MRLPVFCLHVALATILGLGSVAFAEETTGELPRLVFNRDVRPILTDACFACHGADSATREAGLRLDVRDEAIKMSAIVPGSLDQSELVARIALPEEDEMRMPPASSHKSLTEAQKEILRRWITEGAEYQPHWSFIPPTRPEVPAVQQAEWVINPIDAFVLSKLESAGLSPSPEADRRTLARRSALDITGLPPQPQWVDDFLADEQPGAYERYLDRLFREPTWGENRARYWLDYARYADTHGIHFDNFREAWAYRDWVIEAFNQNQSFDQFSIDQLAGDLLNKDSGIESDETESLRRLIATGFNRCNMTTNEGGIIDEEYAVLYARDRVETTSAVWLGLTTGCAACHDHKFDPLTQKDFYSLAAFFNNTTQPVRDGNQSDTPPIVPVPDKMDRDRWWQIQRSIPEAEAVLKQRRELIATTSSELTIPVQQIAETLPTTEKLVLHVPLVEGSATTVSALTRQGILPFTASGAEGKPATIQWETGHVGEKSFVSQPNVTLAFPGLGDFDTETSFTAAAWVYLPKGGKLTGSVIGKIDNAKASQGWDLWLQENRPTVHLVNTWPTRAVKVIARDPLPVEKWTHVAVTHDGSGASSGLKIYVNGVLQNKPDVERDLLRKADIKSSVPLTIGRRLNDSVLAGVRINDVRLYEGTLEIEALQQLVVGTPALFAASRPVKDRSVEHTTAMVDWKLWQDDGEYRDGLLRLNELIAERQEILTRGTIASVMNERSEPAMAHILRRGEYDQRLEPVTAEVPGFLGQLGTRPANRLGLTQWLFSPEHPLTARVTVNRFWQEVFGTGLVRSSADFGITGELPSHPELLDYLAVDFREGGWDVQALFRMILTSATYRQSAVVRQELLAVDPDNRLLGRGPRFRMDAEMVRDAALWAGGLLVPKIGGPSVRPYQPDGVWEAVAMPGSSTRAYQRDAGESLYRRSMYTFWKRAAPPASMELLGAPSREVCTIRRERNNTPLQALVVLNDPQFVEASRGLARDAMSHTDQDLQRLDFMSGRLMSRPLAGPEQLILTEAITGLREHYKAHPEAATELVRVGELKTTDVDVVELAAWTMLASELMNLDETLCK